MKKLTFSFIVFFIFGCISAQPWMQNVPETKRNSQEINFYTVQKAFNDYWADKKYERSSGIKPFRRWEEFMEPRVFPTGTFPHEQLWTEFTKMQAKYAGYKSSANWTHMGPTIAPTGLTNNIPVGVGRINAIAFHPTDPNTLFIGAASGGFWKTTDGGNSWYQTTDDLPVLGVSGLAVDPTNPDIIYMATGDADGRNTYSIGLLKSIDGGETWNTTGLSLSIYEFILARGILINPDSPNEIIVGSGSRIFKSTDGATTFTATFDNQAARFIDLEYKPGDYSVIYASTNGYNNGGIYKSTDGGETFTRFSGILPESDFNRIELAVTPANDQAIYALFSNSSRGLKGVYKSLDEGEHWQEMLTGNELNLLGWSVDGSDGGGQGTYDLSLAVSPIDADEIYVGGVNIWKSTDGGDTWSINAHWSGDLQTEYVHGDQHIFKYSPEGVLFNGNDGGLYKTSDGENWIDISNGINILQIYRLGTSRTDESIAIMGSQDNGTYLTRNNQWNAVVGGDGMEGIIDYEDPNIMYGTSQYGSIYKSEDGGYSFSDISPAVNGAWITPYIMHPTDHNILFAGYTRVYKTTDRGETWEDISGSIFGENLRTLTISPSNPDYIYAGTTSSLYKTTDGGETWTNISENLPFLSISYTVVSHNDPETIWVTFSGYAEDFKVFTTTDGGITWTPYSEGLPNIPANCIVYQNNSDDLLYVGTDLGIFYRDNSMAEWQPYNDGLPNVIVRELEIHYATQRLRAATYGRGLWESQLYDDGTNAPAPSFTVNKKIACGDEIIEFSDMSSYSPSSWEWSFEPNTVTFANGTDKYSANPEVQFNEAGNYNVTLTATNGNGSNDITKSEYILQTNIKTDFYANVSLSYPGGRVELFDISECDPISWEWIFEPSTVTFIEGTDANSQNPVVSFDAIGEYSVTLSSTNSLGTDIEIKSEYISIGNNYFIDNNEITTCDGLFYDAGGPFQNYNDSENYTMTFIPNNDGAKLIVDFTEFKVEDHPSCEYDYLNIFDGPTTESSFIGQYCGENSPGEITSTHSTGALTFQFHADGGVNDLGWIATIACTPTSAFELNEKDYTRIDIYPNPSPAVFNIDIKGLRTTSLNISVFDIEGRQINNESHINVGSDFSSEVDLQDLSKGIYVIKIETDKTTIQEKLILK